MVFGFIMGATYSSCLVVGIRIIEILSVKAQTRDLVRYDCNTGTQYTSQQTFCRRSIGTFELEPDVDIDYLDFPCGLTVYPISFESPSENNILGLPVAIIESWTKPCLKIEPSFIEERMVNAIAAFSSIGIDATPGLFMIQCLSY